MRLSERDLEQLARMHVESLPDSLVSELGTSYARAFYGYVAVSSKELLLLERDPGENIAGACVVSLEPESLNRRLLLKTPLLYHLVPKIPRFATLLFRSLLGTQRGDGHAPLSAPELILIFTSGSARGKGLGTKLIRQAEARLRTVGIRSYLVRTAADPANRALGFYRGLGFEPLCIVSRHGQAFQMFTRSVPEVGSVASE